MIVFASLLAMQMATAQTTGNGYNPQAVPTSMESLYPEWAVKEFNAEVSTALSSMVDASPKTTSRSPRNFFGRIDASRFSFYRDKGTQGNPVNDGVYHLAHRGLVDLSKKINENTLDAVQRAVQNGIFMVELDIQASKDGKPVVTHDDSLSRTTTLDNPVNFYDAAFYDTEKRATYIKSPQNKETLAQPYYCKNGHQLMTFESLFKTMEGASTHPRESVSGRVCDVRTGITYFLDPKSLASGQSVFKFIADSSRSGTEPKKFFVKTYDNHWSPSNPNDAARQALLGLTLLETKRIQVMPVISIRSFLDKSVPDFVGAVSYATGIVKAWNDAGVSVAAVEFPGAWDNKWAVFVHDFYVELHRDRRTYLNNNPYELISISPGTSERVHYSPVLSYGYRFPDFSKRNSGGVIEFFNWGMDGQSKLDTTDKARGTLGSAYLIAGEICKNGFFLGRDRTRGDVYQSGCFVTTDFPHWESKINRNGKKSTFLGSPERSVDLTVTPTN